MVTNGKGGRGESYKSPNTHRLYIAEWLKKKGRTQKWLAGKLDVDEGSVSRYINRQRSVNTDLIRDIEIFLELERGHLFYHPSEVEKMEEERRKVEEDRALLARLRSFATAS